MHTIMHVRMLNRPIIIIAAISSRPYVQAAVDAGFDVIAIDAFIDQDTQEEAKRYYQLGYQDGQLHAEALMQVLNEIDLTQVDGFYFGAGFEMNPDLLSLINEVVPVVGNSVDAIKQCKLPHQFFALCDMHAMLYPTYTYDRPKDSQGWLKKKIGGSGGHHISLLVDSDAEEEGVYYQKIQQGDSLSCLFLADQQQVKLIGVNEQWTYADHRMPYRYGGATSRVNLDETIKSRLMHFLMGVVKKLGLVGLNSCDFILQHDEIYMLEINPRLSASIDLYRPVEGNLFAAHAAACKGESVKQFVTSASAIAHQIIYATNDLMINDHQHWPDWVCDIPQPNQHISAGMPICTVIAEADKAEQAKQLVKERAVFI
jgi:uncharacterized protein